MSNMFRYIIKKMLNKICLVFSVIFIIIRLSEQVTKIDKKVEIKHITMRYEEDSTTKIDVSMRKFNRTHTVVNANATLTETMDKRYRFSLELRVWSDGGWKRNYVTYSNNDPCVQLKYTLGKTWNDIAKAAKLNYNCPYFAGKYKIVDYYINVASVPVLFGSGTFKLIIQVFKEKKFIIEMVIDLELNDVI